MKVTLLHVWYVADSIRRAREYRERILGLAVYVGFRQCFKWKKNKSSTPLMK